MPQKVRELHGERRPSRTRIEPQPAETEPQPPAWLSEAQRAVWDRVVEDLEHAGIAFRMDSDTIAAYASSVTLFTAAEQVLAREGPVKSDRDGNERRNPWLFVRQSALDGVNRFGSLLGMSPAARARLGARDRDAEEDPAERLLS